MKRLSINLHVGGVASIEDNFKYKVGWMAEFENVDCDLMGFFTVVAFAKDSGFKPSRMWYGIPDGSVTEIKEDKDVLEMCDKFPGGYSVDVYCEGSVDAVTEGNEELLDKSEESDPSEVETCDFNFTEDEEEHEEESADIVEEAEENVDLLGLAEQAANEGGGVDIQIEDAEEGDAELDVQMEDAGAINMEEDDDDDDQAKESEYEKSDDEIFPHDGTTTIRARRKFLKAQLSIYDPHCDHKHLKLRPGLCFETAAQMHGAIQKYAIANGFNLRWNRSSTLKQEAVCEPWRIYASWMKKEGSFVVKDLVNIHTCARNMQNRQATTKWLAEQFVEGNIRRAGATAKEIRQEVMKKFTIEVTLMKIYKACSLAEKMMVGSVDEHFKMLRSYLAVLRNKFPGSIFELSCDLTPSTGLYTTFRRLFIGFQPLMKGFLVGCRHVVRFDGTFIKNKVGGILLSAVGRDGNDGMYPIAWAVVEGENQNSWLWFLDILFKALEVRSGQGWTFISDQQKGLLNAISSLAPEAESRNCSRHIYQNWKVKHRGLFLKSCFYRVVKSTNEFDFNIALREMKVGRDGIPGSLDATADFESQGTHHFCKAFFNTSTKRGTHSNNICETFNSYIVAARRLPLIDMLERIRRLLMVRQFEKKKSAAKIVDVLCPQVRKDIESAKEDAAKYIVKASISEKFEVSMPLSESDRFLVDLRIGSCSCKYWDLHGIPCPHALSCILFMKRRVEDYVFPFLMMEAYRKAYMYVLEPLEGSKFWPKVDGEPIRPPPYKKLPGRPKKQKRKKSKEEDPKGSGRLTRKGLGMRCKLCGNWGHNRRSCKRQPSTPQQEISQPLLTEQETEPTYGSYPQYGSGHH